MGIVKRKQPRGAAPSHGSVADALFSRTQQRVLGLLFGQPDRQFGLLELIGLAASGRGAVQRELERLVKSELVSSVVVGRQKTYRANAASPIFEELRSIIEKTSGVPAVLRAALSPLAPQLQLAILYGSVAHETDRASSDIDVLIVSDELPLEQVFEALQTAETKLGRRVSPTVYTRQEFQRRRDQPFLSKVLAKQHVVLYGSEDANAAR